MSMKRIASYEADAGTFVVNGVGINNGIGDGGFDVFYAEHKEDIPKSAKEVKDLWIDLRNGYPVVIHTYDCNKKGDEYMPNKELTAKHFPNAQALKIFVRSGDIYFVKYF